MAPILRTLSGVVPFLVFVAAAPAFAQLTEDFGLFEVVPGGHVGTSLEKQVGKGHGDELAARA